MELIYTDSELNDVGVLKEATCDFAIGKDENDFEITTTKRSAKLTLGGYCYYENTEYGGIIDSVESSNNSEEVKYNGRAWTGLLNSFVMNFDSEYMNYNGTQYTVVEGTKATDLVSELIEHIDLPIIIEEFDGVLNEVSVDARLGLYDFISAVLKANMMKLYFRYNKGIHLYVSGASSYDDENNFDSKQMSIIANKGRKFTNHFVLYNSDIYKSLDIYTDEVGNIKPYSNVDLPLEDSDYIYTDDNKVLTGQDEVVSVIDDTSKQENYKLLTSNAAPKDWNYAEYYEYVLKEGTEDEYEYKKLEENTTPYQVTNAPAMWEYEWSSYFKVAKGGSTDNLTQLSTDDAPKTTAVTAVIRDGTSPQVDPPYIQLSAKQWADKWDKDNYCTRTWDGNKWVYTKAEGVTAYAFELLGSEPTGWGADKGNYWVNDSLTTYTFQRCAKSKGKVIVQDTIVCNQYNYTQKKYKVTNTKGKLVTLVSLCKTPNKLYKANGPYYYRLTKKVVDNSRVTISTYCKRRGRTVGSFKFSEVRDVYRRYEKDRKDPPVWQEPNQDHANPKGYFLVVDANTGAPNFTTLTASYDIYGKVGTKKPYAKNTFYKKVEDHFVNLIEKAKEDLAKQLDELESTSAELNIETYEFDVGDYVGGINPLTNEPFKSVVTKKIAKIDSFNAEVSYEIG